MKIGIKLTLTFFLVACISMLVIGFIDYRKAKDSLEKESFNKLRAVREMKAAQIEDYFQQIQDQIVTLAEDPTLIQAMQGLKQGYKNIDQDLEISDTDMRPVNMHLDEYYDKEYLPRLNQNLTAEKASKESEAPKEKNARILQEIYVASALYTIGQKHRLTDPGDGSSYTQKHIIYHPILRNYLEKFGYYDIFLVDETSGEVVYTCFKEVDFCTNLTTGPYAKTNLAESFRMAANSLKKGETAQVDFQPYHPSYNQPSAFVSTPIYDGKNKIGVLIFQMPIDNINSIMTSKGNWEAVGLGKTGETYIVGEDFMLRNQSRFLIEDSASYFSMVKAIGLAPELISRIRNFNSVIGLQPVKTEGTQEALKGITGEKTFNDYRNIPVLSSYKPLKVEDMHWVIMSEIDEEEAFSYVYAIRRQMIIAISILLILIAAGSILISKRITKPLLELTGDARELAKGNFNVDIGIHRKDEIGILASSFRKMQISIRKLVSDLKDINQNLEQKVEDRTREINLQKELVELQNKEIVDSINYALRLQQAILPTKESFNAALNENFILYKPKSIVSGDFYWMHRDEESIWVASVDCTGHGVPGALVSLVGANSLERCVNEFNLKRPSEILDKLRELVIKTFESDEHDVKDGMDISLIRIRYQENGNAMVDYAGAHNPLWYIRKENRQTEEIKANKQPIGVFDFGVPFVNHKLELQKGDLIYLFSDGYADQFGGPMGKKFRYKTLKNMLETHQDKSMHEQVQILDKTLEDWKGNLEQIDDICVIGVRI
jgi:serine phosphatase RsbU (regulator of sigma subunit)